MGIRLSAEEKKLSNARYNERKRVYQAARRAAMTSEQHAARKANASRRYYDRRAREAQGKCGGGQKCQRPLIGNAHLCLWHWIRSLCTNRKRKSGKIAYSDARHETIDTLEAIWHEQRGCCAITGAQLVPGVNASLDHILPVNRGGAGDKTNLRFVHRAVNFMKGDMTDEEFSVLLLELGPALTLWANRTVSIRLRSAVCFPAGSTVSLNNSEERPGVVLPVQ